MMYFSQGRASRPGPALCALLLLPALLLCAGGALRADDDCIAPQFSLSSTPGTGPNCYSDGTITIIIDMGTKPEDSQGDWRLRDDRAPQAPEDLEQHAFNLEPGADGHYRDTVLLENLCPGPYTVYVYKHAGGWCYASKQISVGGWNCMKTWPKCLDLNGCEPAGVQDPWKVCMDISGGELPYSFKWFRDGAPFSNSLDLVTIETGYYSYRFSDAGGCVLEGGFYLGPLEALGVEVVQGLNCHGDSDAGVRLNWRGGFAELYPGYNMYHLHREGRFLYEGRSSSVSGLSAGTYTMTVFNADDDLINFHSCLDALSFTIEEPDPLEPQLTVSREIPCDTTSGGELLLTIEGGTPDYHAKWFQNDLPRFENTGDVQTFPDASPGTWRVDITDANGCTTSATVELTDPANDEPMSIAFDISAYQAPHIGIDCAAHAVAQPGGGRPPYSYKWRNHNGDQPWSNQKRPCTFVLLVSDARGCEALDSVYVPDCIPDEEEDDVWLIVPNPNDGHFDIQLDLELDTDVRYELHDSGGGIVVQAAPGTLSAGRHTIPLDISGQPDGQYFLSMILGADPPRTKLVQKQ